MADEITIQPDEQEHARFLSLDTNEDRRIFVAREFQSGHFSDVSHLNFFVEQAAKGEILVSDEQKESLSSLLLNGTEGYEGLFERKERIAERVLQSGIHQSTPSYLTPTGQTISSEISLNDLGATDYLKDLGKADRRDEFYELVFAARKQALDQQYKGDAPDHELQIRLQQKREKLPWYQFKRKREADKALAAINPAYYDEKNHALGLSLKQMSGYYQVRSWLKNRSKNAYYDRLSSLEKALDCKQAYDGMRWFSKDGFKKMKLLAGMPFNRFINHETQRLLAVANQAQLEDFTKRLGERLKATENPDPTPLKIRAANNTKESLEQIKKAVSVRKASLEKIYSSKLQALKAAYPEHNTQTNLSTEFREGIIDKAKKMQKDLKDILSQDSAYQLLQKINSQNKSLTEKAITADRVMETLLKEMKIDENSEQGKALSALFQKTQEEKEEKEIEEQKENAESEQEYVQHSQPLEDREELTEDKKIEVSRGHDNEGETISSDGNPWVHNAEENIFIVSSDELTVEKIAALVSAIKEQSKDGSFTLDVEKFSEAELEAFKQAAKEQDLKILDKKGKEISLEKEEKQEIVVEREQPKKENQEEQGITTKETPEQEQGAKDKTDETPKPEEKEDESHKEQSEDRKNTEHTEEESAKDLSSALTNAMMGKTAEEQAKVINFFAEVQNGQYNATSVEDFQKLMKEKNINPKSPAGQFLGNLAAAKSMEAEITADKELSKDKSLKGSLKEDKKEVGLGQSDKKKIDKLNVVTDLFKKYDGKADEMEKDNAFKLLPPQLKKNMKTIVSESDPKNKEKMRTAVLAELISHKQYRGRGNKNTSRTRGKSMGNGQPTPPVHNNVGRE